jgi:hypothetical protein
MTTPTRDSGRPIIVAVTTEDGRLEHVRRRAVELARERDAAVVLYDLDAGKPLFESPMPTNWAAEGEQEQFDERLGLNDLETLGRRPLADQLRATRAEGVEAWGWLPDATDTETLHDYATRHGADLVVVPGGDEFADLEGPVETVEPEADEAG